MGEDDSELSANLTVREASHAGAWYSSDSAELRAKMRKWLDNARSAGTQPPSRAARAVISPHAGYSYSGPTAAHAYLQLANAAVKPERVYVLGPSHHTYTQLAELTSFGALATPLGDLRVDLHEVARLQRAEPALFTTMDAAHDEAEHSIEMQLPFLKFVLPDAKVVPIVIGAVDERRERRIARALAPMLRDPRNAFVVSSDFCHWGKRFGFTGLLDKDEEARQAEREERDGSDVDDDEDDDDDRDDERSQHPEKPIWRRIEHMDRAGMAAIASLDASRYAAYQERTKNTICGRHSIAVLLHAVALSNAAAVAAAEESAAPDAAPPAMALRFLHYTQSSRCVTPRDSSVSYAAGVLELVV